jgi:hypothetical protein
MSQPLANDALERLRSAFRVAVAEFHAMAVAEVEFGKIAVESLL